ncbi:MAG TPA: O-antigen ligase family protein [Anaerolineae bacterium]|nr:O-antigen ligase family protein [Anaerolineae bacterium]
MTQERLLETPRMSPITATPQTRRAIAAQLYSIALPFVFLIVALLIFPNSLTPLGMIGVVLLCMLRWAARGSPIPTTSASVWLLIFFALFALGLLLSPVPNTAWMVASHALAGFTIFITIIDRADSLPRIFAATGITVLVGAMFAFGAPFAAAWSEAQNFNISQLTSRFVPLLARPSNVNNIAGALEASIPLALALIAARVRPWRIVGAFALAPVTIMLLLLQSRGAWLAVLMAIVVYVTLYRRWVLPFVPLVLLAGLWLNVTFGEPVPVQAVEREKSEVVTLGDRTQIWSEAMRLSISSPLGIGVNGFSVFGKPRLGVAPNDYELRGSHAHNLFLEIALDTGWIGLLAFLGFLFIGIRAAWRVYRANPTISARALAIGLLAAFTIIIAHGIFDTIFWGFKAEIFLWATVAISLALERVGAG